jgi:hypothetical protein
MSAPRPWAAGPELPGLRDLEYATRATATVLGDPEATLEDVRQAAELEAATLHAYWQSGLIARAELEAHGPEAEIG